jgi:hypothetical protein
MMLLFAFSASAILDIDAPLEMAIPENVVELDFPEMIQFLIVLFVEPFVELKLANQKTDDVNDVLVLLIVKFLVVVPELDPSMVIKSAPLNLNIASVELPIIFALTPVFGFIIIEFIELAAGLEINIGKLSAVL